MTSISKSANNKMRPNSCQKTSPNTDIRSNVLSDATPHLILKPDVFTNSDMF